MALRKAQKEMAIILFAKAFAAADENCMYICNVGKGSASWRIFL